MSLQTERIAIETYFAAQWGVTTPYILDGHPGEPSPSKPVQPCVRLTITDGAVLQGSIGRAAAGANVLHNIGLVTFQLFTNAALGSSSWRGYAQTLLEMFHNKTLDGTGALFIGGAQTPVVRFSPPELGNGKHPYIGAQMIDVPFRMTNVIAPFLRYEIR